MASNEFDALLADLAVVQQLRESADLRKGLTLDGARQALAKAEKPARRGPLFQQLPAHLGRSVPRQPVKVDVRAMVQDVMAKAMSLFESGVITAAGVAKIEATCHRLASVRR